jgi:hypothetical protein
MAPLTLSVALPPLKTRIVGTPDISNLVARRGFSWVFICTITPAPAIFLAAYCTTCANSMQCGHHGAQNSARNGPGKFFAKLSKVLSERTNGLV